MGALAIFKKRFSRKFLINFFVFGLYVAAVKVFAGLMITYFQIDNSGYYLIISLMLLAVTFAFIKYSLYLIKEEKEHLL
ncbi:hypothetical protein C1638_020870 [Chryseobacterium oncorhynchi]|uniref:Uncharacterized protein n=2 Tax=Chryseobacterium oncorhynchi TaxID=741074 RepID=A0A316WF19_9FLAO|nr:hypothetical protein C1638_020870 [Chryseobacterium oncorhynchi]